MSNIAFKNTSRYPDYKSGYNLFCKRRKKEQTVPYNIYKKIVDDYCSYIAERLVSDGMVDLPSKIGTLIVTEFNRKPQYRENKFVGYGKWDWNNRRYDGSNKALGVLLLPRRDKTNNLRSYGFVANRRLYIRIKEFLNSDYCNWKPMIFNEKMI